MIKPHRILFALAALPGFAYLAMVAVIIAAMACKVGAKYSFNINDGWNAYWASAAWSGADLYPPPSALKLNNYPPLWFYLSGAIGHLAGDIIRAGRAVAAAALLLTGVVIALIAREIAGTWRAAWIAGTAFIAIFGLIHQDYAGANDPQVLASLVMTFAVLLAVRSAGETPGLAVLGRIVAVMIVAGLIKHNIVAAPFSIALFYLLSGRPRALAGFVGLSIVGGALACAGLYLAYGTSIFASLLFPRPYSAGIGWAQTFDQLRQYGLLLAVIPFLAVYPGPKARLVAIYAVVALLLGAALSGGYGVDFNVFFDALFCISVGLGVMGAAVPALIAAPERSNGLRLAATAGWIAVALVPPLIAAPSASADLAEAFAAIADTSYAVDLRTIRSAPARTRSAGPGTVVCRDLALCYWAGRPFTLDLNTLRIIVAHVPALEDTVVGEIEACRFALIELDLPDAGEDPLTDRMRRALVSHYTIAQETPFGVYWRPRCR
ncbi:MAG TPA: hypothetical protein VLX44_15915 [Xanthobacteraceae bacterium]|nr:hypothetical protein [Xanthobacteraceae bacterium]